MEPFYMYSQPINDPLNLPRLIQSLPTLGRQQASLATAHQVTVMQI